MVTLRDVVIVLNRGSDIRFDLEFRDDNDAAIDMTEHTIAIFEGDTWATANGSVAWVNQAGGIARLAAEWGSAPPRRAASSHPWTRQ